MKRSIVILGAAGSLLLALSAATGQEAASGEPDALEVRKDRPDPVSIMKHGILQQVDFNDLKRQHPSSSASGLDEAALRADAIVGWYDSGHNYHAERMSGRTPGNEVMDPANRKGKGLRGEESERKGKDPKAAGAGRKGKDPKAQGVDRKGKDPKAQGVDRKGKDPKAQGVDRKGKDPKAQGVDRKGKDPKAQGVDRKGKDVKPEAIERKGKDAQAEGAAPEAQGSQRKGKDPKAGGLKEKATGIQELER